MSEKVDKQEPVFSDGQEKIDAKVQAYVAPYQPPKINMKVPFDQQGLIFGIDVGHCRSCKEIFIIGSSARICNHCFDRLIHKEAKEEAYQNKEDE